jgi:hypothetical protein
MQGTGVDVQCREGIMEAVGNVMSLKFHVEQSGFLDEGGPSGIIHEAAWRIWEQMKELSCSIPSVPAGHVLDISVDLVINVIGRKLA